MNQQCFNDFSTTNVERCVRLFGWCANLPARWVSRYTEATLTGQIKKTKFF